MMLVTTQIETTPEPAGRAIQWTGDNREAVEGFLDEPHAVEKVMAHPVTDAKTLYVMTPEGLKSVPEGYFLISTGDRLEVFDADSVRLMGKVEIVGDEST